MSGQIDKEFRPLVAELRQIQGIELVARKGNNHVFIFWRGRRITYLPTSCGDTRRGVHLLKSQLRRAGVPI